jgi:hypothetical protein
MLFIIGDLAEEEYRILRVDIGNKMNAQMRVRGKDGWRGRDPRRSHPIVISKGPPFEGPFAHLHIH